ncbi:MAG: uncharacterized protein KVP18_002060, partial [Porospora cf. gigantea A]
MESVTLLHPQWIFRKPSGFQEAELGFDGNDAIGLFHMEDVKDRLGKKGANDIWGREQTLRRNINDTVGDTDLNAPFNASDHYEELPVNTVDGLGCTGAACELPTPDATSTEESTETFSTESTETFSTESTETFSTESTETFSTESTETFSTESTETFSTDATSTEESTETF